MQCPLCLYPDSKVIDSRAADEGIRRRRECLGCGERFTTYERVQRAGTLVIKKDARREEFSREKVLLGLRKAAEKRPLAAGVIEAVADDIEAQVHALGLAEVPSDAIGEMVMRHLRELDQVAYIRFASVYRAFTDVESIVREIEALERTALPSRDQLPLLSTEEMAEVEEHPVCERCDVLRAVGGGRRRPSRGVDDRRRMRSPAAAREIRVIGRPSRAGTGNAGTAGSPKGREHVRTGSEEHGGGGAAAG